MLLVIAMLYCAYKVMNAHRLLHAVIWLALTSATTAILIYTLAAAEVTVIQLSVGTGLVIVLFVFAFSIVGEATVDEITLIPRPFVWLTILAAAFVLGWFVFPIPIYRTSALRVPFGRLLWEQRSLDVIAQIVFIFSGVMGLIGLLSETRPAVDRASLVSQEDQAASSPGDEETAGAPSGADQSIHYTREVTA